MARRPHPDANPELDQKRKDLWYEVQAAYDAKDLDRMETLSAMSDIYDDNLKSIESVWSLKNLCLELQSGLSNYKSKSGATKRTRRGILRKLKPTQISSNDYSIRSGMTKADMDAFTGFG
ncbi:MAG: hypothetical protein AABZ06_00335 [Bdellovibrionota bacterium]